MDNPIANNIYIAWDDDPELFQISFANQLYKNSRLATLQEVIKHGAECNNFINSINSDELVEVTEGVFKTLWETNRDPVGFEEHYLYLIDYEGNKHLVY